MIFEYLREGDVIIQNAANSAVGLCVMQFAKRLGVTCVNLVRSEDRLSDLKSFGANEVWLDNEDVPQRIQEFTDKRCAMALNSVGGRSAVRLTKCVSGGGVHITFGAMDSELVRFPTRNLIFDDIDLLAFGLIVGKEKSLSQLRNSLEEVLQPLALNEVKYPIDSVFAIDDFKAALRRNSESRFGKVLLARDKEMIEKSIN